jgi:MFS family permease
MMQPRSRSSTLRRSLAFCTAEGAIAEVVIACEETLFVPAWALYLGMSPFLIGVLGAMPRLAQLVQLPAAWLTSRFGARRVSIFGLFIARQFSWAFVLLPLLPLSPAAQCPLLLALFAIKLVPRVIGHNAWLSWMNRLVPSRLRGRYFGRRTETSLLGTLGGLLIAGRCLDYASAAGQTRAGLVGLAAAAAIAGALTTLLMTRQHDPERKGEAAIDARSSTSLSRATLQRVFSNGAARRLLGYLAWWNASIGLASSFYVIYVIGTLKIGYATLTLCEAGVIVGSILSSRMWGRVIDRIGAKPVIILTTLGLSFMPLLWASATAEWLLPILIDAALSGALLGGHQVATRYALPMALAPREESAHYIATFKATAGIAFSLASICGGIILWSCSLSAGTLRWLFLLSFGLRFASLWPGLRIVEPRAVPLRVWLRAFKWRRLVTP